MNTPFSTPYPRHKHIPYEHPYHIIYNSPVTVVLLHRQFNLTQTLSQPLNKDAPKVPTIFLLHRWNQLPRTPANRYLYSLPTLLANDHQPQPPPSNPQGTKDEYQTDYTSQWEEIPHRGRAINLCNNASSR